MNIRQSWDPQWPRAGPEHRTGAGCGNVLADAGDQQRPDWMGTGRRLVARTAVTSPALGSKAPSGVSRLLNLRTDSPHLTFLGGASGKEPTCQCGRCRSHGFHPWVENIPWRRAWQTHSSILAWRIPWTKEPCGLRYIGSQRVGHE